MSNGLVRHLPSICGCCRPTSPAEYKTAITLPFFGAEVAKLAQAGSDTALVALRNTEEANNVAVARMLTVTWLAGKSRERRVRRCTMF